MARAIELFNGSMTHQAQLARDTALRMRAPAQNRMHFACIAKMNACFIAKFICELGIASISRAKRQISPPPTAHRLPRLLCALDLSGLAAMALSLSAIRCDNLAARHQASNPWHLGFGGGSGKSRLLFPDPCPLPISEPRAHLAATLAVRRPSSALASPCAAPRRRAPRVRPSKPRSRALSAIAPRLASSTRLASQRTRTRRR